MGNNSRTRVAARCKMGIDSFMVDRLDAQRGRSRPKPVAPPAAEEKKAAEKEKPPLLVDLGNLTAVPAETKASLAKFLKEAGIFPADDKAEILMAKLLKAGCKVSLGADKRVWAINPSGAPFVGTSEQFSIFVFRYNT